MVVVHRLNGFALGVGIGALLLLAGCAQNQTNPDTAQQEVVQSRSAADKAAPVAPQVAEEAKPDYATMNPVPIVFEKLSVKLRDADKAVLAQIGDRAVKARRLVITGFCDSRQVGNPKAAAIARATAVKDELVRLGAKPSMIRIRYLTNVPDKHA